MKARSAAPVYNPPIAELLPVKEWRKLISGCSLRNPASHCGSSVPLRVGRSSILPQMRMTQLLPPAHFAVLSGGAAFAGNTLKAIRNSKDNLMLLYMRFGHVTRMGKKQLLQSTPLIFKFRLGKRKILALLAHNILPLAAEYVRKEFTQFGIQRRTRRSIHL